jgi:hypothetical protein
MPFPHNHCISFAPAQTSNQYKYASITEWQLVMLIYAWKSWMEAKRFTRVRIRYRSISNDIILTSYVNVHTFRSDMTRGSLAQPPPLRLEHWTPRFESWTWWRWYYSSGSVTHHSKFGRQDLLVGCEGYRTIADSLFMYPCHNAQPGIRTMIYRTTQPLSNPTLWSLMTQGRYIYLA